jgi:tRNA C32,U32 (ribose-2'-O)-methylase TrmJ
MDPSLLSKVLSLYENGKFIPKNKRKTTTTAGESSQSLLEKKTISIPVAPAVVTAAAAIIAKRNIVDSIYDSIYDDLPMEKYDPLAADQTPVPAEEVKKKKTAKSAKKKPKKEPENVAVIFTDSEEEEEEEEEEETEEEEEGEIPPSQSLKGLFQNVKQTVVQIPKPPQESTSNTLTSLFTSAVRTATHSNQTLSSVSSLLKKDKQLEELHSKYGVTTSSSATTTGTKKRVTLAEEEEEEKKKKALIHRDVFASTLENVVYVDSKYGKKEGEKFGTAAEGTESYDIFPETTGEFGEVSTRDSVLWGLLTICFDLLFFFSSSFC